MAYPFKSKGKRQKAKGNIQEGFKRAILVLGETPLRDCIKTRIRVFFITKNSYILFCLLPLASCLLPLAFPYWKMLTTQIEMLYLLSRISTDGSW
ncbi:MULTISPECIES: hypothetical protein [unclassified Moorena]|uniref:hypothetical protein n=1 Tax=unclassified Moorena TaxID=2683338 RepID=UPI001400FE65|nr:MULTISPECIES: hypothetical protein [unclassified Moorena]NEO12157.1 hypothetical protein [Moorena sp. SIO3E8]NEQ00930.1 hypothetical protein [Moorena sp. SIO3F7]